MATSDGKTPDSPVDVPVQHLLFADEAEAIRQALAKRAQLDTAHAEKLARKAAWDAGQPYAEDQAKWYAAHPELREITNARCRESYRANSEWHKHATARRRAEYWGCEIGDRDAILEIYRKARHPDPILCHWCGKLTERWQRHVDHIIPLSRRGPHRADNLCIVCSTCNESKGDLMPEDFLAKCAQSSSPGSCSYILHR